MTLQEIQNQALQLPLDDRWRLVQSLLNSIKQEMVSSTAPNPGSNSFADLDLWTQSLIGVISLSAAEPTESCVDYFEEKYS